MCANERVFHQPKVVDYIAALYSKCLLRGSFASLSRTKDSHCVLHVRVKLSRLLLTVLIEWVSLCEDYYVNVKGAVSVDRNEAFPRYMQSLI